MSTKIKNNIKEIMQYKKWNYLDCLLGYTSIRIYNTYIIMFDGYIPKKPNDVTIINSYIIILNKKQLLYN